MSTDRDDQVEYDLSIELRMLRERVAFLEGRRKGTFRTLEVVVPVVLFILAVAGVTAIGNYISNVVEGSVGDEVHSAVGTKLAPELIQNQVDQAVATAVKDYQDRIERAVDEAEDAKAEAQNAKSGAEQAKAEAQNAKSDAEGAKLEAEGAKATAEGAAVMVETVVATEAVP